MIVESVGIVIFACIFLESISSVLILIIVANETLLF